MCFAALRCITPQAPDARFERRGDDLLMNHTISLVDALVGFKHTILHLDGHEVTLSATGVTRPGDWQPYPGEGMPVYGSEVRHGQLWVQYTVDFPRRLSEEQKEAVRKLFEPAAK